MTFRLFFFQISLDDSAGDFGLELCRRGFRPADAEREANADRREWIVHFYRPWVGVASSPKASQLGRQIQVRI